MQVDGNTMTAAPPAIQRLNVHRALALLGSALFGMVTRTIERREAQASHSYWNICQSFHKCSCCSGANCCAANCSVLNACTQPNGTIAQCWNVSIPRASGCYDIYRCCDWKEPAPAGNCNCQGYLGQLCP